MSALALALLLAQAPPLKVAVIDISDSDAIYEDVSRALAEDVVKVLRAAGFEAVRVDESELPEAGCQVGPCLAKVARDQQAQVLVALDAKELDKVKLGVGLTALLGSNGTPLAGGRYVVRADKKRAPKELPEFAARLMAEVTKLYRPALRAPDAGAADAGTARASTGPPADGGRR